MKHAYFLVICLLLTSGLVTGQDSSNAAIQALIKRVLPNHHYQITTEWISRQDGGRDRFEISSRNDRIVLSGTSAVSIASALNWYLKYIARVQLSWCGSQMHLPEKLPSVTEPIRIASPYESRVYLNYCTFNYSMSWWDWERWEQEIDWMAMHGINMPLAVTGQEAVWQRTLRRFNMTDDEIRQFLVGPAYGAWQWMTNIESIFGPLPQAWIDRSVELQQKILARQRSLGMTPILQGFTGYVPLALIKKQPEAKILQKPIWFYVGPGTAQLDPLDPLFEKMSRAFLEEQTRLFGTDHLYAADPFHEGEPPEKGDAYLAQVGRAIVATTLSVDPKARIAMQTWSMRKAIVTSIPEDRILMLDLNASRWKGSEAFWGRPWVAGIIHNFGGNTVMGGNLSGIIERFPAILADKNSGKLTGIGLFPEAIGHNPIIYEAASEMAWRREAPVMKDWLQDYVHARYGRLDKKVLQVWDSLLELNYGVKTRIEPFMESAICSRPALKINGASPNGALNSPQNYRFSGLWEALGNMLSASDSTQITDTYQYDLADLTRQCLADLSIQLQQELADAYRKGDQRAFRKSSRKFLLLMDDLNRLLGSRSEFLLGKWIEDARKIGKTEAEKDLYEQNARSLLTIYGPYDPKAIQYDYAARQWNGLIRHFYKPRWKMFIDFLDAELSKPVSERYVEEKINHEYNRPANESNPFYRKLSSWEVDWTLSHQPSLLTKPEGNTYKLSRAFYHRWVREMKP